MSTWFSSLFRKAPSVPDHSGDTFSDDIMSRDFPGGLVEHINACRLYRRGIQSEDLRKKPICVCCQARDVEAASSFFETTYGFAPNLFAIVQWRSDWLNGKSVARIQQPTISLEELASRQDLQPVLYVHPPRERTLTRLLAEYGIRDLFFFSEPAYAPSLSTRDYVERNLHSLQTVYKLLADAESRETFCSVLRQRRENCCGYLRLASYPEYEHPLCQAVEGDTVIDGGGFDGQTSLRFAHRVGTDGKVYCFEPVSRNLELVQNTLKSIEDSPLSSVVQVVAMGVGDCEETVSIAVAGGSSKIEGSGGMSAGKAAQHEEIRVTTLDSFWESTGRSRLDLISLDIEGLEMAALRGAENVIRQFRPKLQISLYHKPEDLYEIPLWLDGLGLGYRFYLGHHDSFLVETDLYAVSGQG